MKIKKVAHYNRHGCNIKGWLLVFEYWDDLKAMNSRQFLGGFGQNNACEFTQYIRTKIQESNIKGEIKLSIPDFVFSLDANVSNQELDDFIGSFS